MNHSPKHWTVIPAAGSGRRMGSEVPKQYLPLHGRTVIEHTLARFIDHPRIDGIMVALSPGDARWQELGIDHSNLHTTDGGAERCHSVLNALNALAELGAQDHDWVLVHDAARPCLRGEDIDHLLREAGAHPGGGLLGLPIADTVKRTDSRNQVVATVDRNGLWRALTPQMFRLGALRRALAEAVEAGHLVTDEAAAMERGGGTPLMVEGHSDNIKITHPGDLALADLYLTRQE